MKIGTWNIQGELYNDKSSSSYLQAKTKMIKNDLDVLCLQETGLIEKNNQVEMKLYNNKRFTKIEKLNIGTHGRPFYVNCYKYYFGDTDYRCSMAILVKCDIDENQPAIMYIGNNLRPVFGILLNTNIAIYNIHAPSTNGSPYTINYIKSAIRDVSNILNKYNVNEGILVGDYNATPDTLGCALQKDPNIQAHIFAPKNNKGYEQTQKEGGCLDYCCCINNSNIPKISVDSDAAFSDHRTVIFDFE